MSRFVRAANRGENHWAFYGLTVFVILLAFVLGSMPIKLIIEHKMRLGTLSPAMLAEFHSTYDFSILGMPTYVGLMLMLLGHALAAIVLCGSVVYVHKRPIVSVVTSRRPVDFGRVIFAFGLWMALSFLAEFVMYGMFPEDYSFNVNLRSWLPLLLVSLLLLPIQTTFEEVLIRGYFLQGVGLLTRSKWIVIVITSIIFAAMHLGNPEVREYGIGLMTLYYMSVALFLAIITFLDEGLELAIGIHAATNVYGSTVVSFEGSVLQTDSLIRLDHLNPVWMIVLFFGMMLLFVIIAAQKYKLQHFSTLFARIELEETEDLST